MLLANVTIPEKGAEQLLQLGQAKLAGLHCAMLLQLFTVSAVTLAPGEKDPFEHVAAVLVNVTRLKSGRELLLQPGRGLLQVGTVLPLCAGLPQLPCVLDCNDCPCVLDCHSYILQCLLVFMCRSGIS